MRELPRSAGGDVMSHGDLIPGNVLVSGGRLAGIIDVGGLGPADPALDLVVAWHLLEAGPRQVFRDDLGCDDLEWERGKAWAFEQAMGAVWYYVESNPAMSRMGRRTLERIQEADPAALPTGDGLVPAHSLRTHIHKRGGVSPHPVNISGSGWRSWITTMSYDADGLASHPALVCLNGRA